MEMSKHAYLILAHNNFYILEKLIKLLDDERNDIFIHVDKKINNFDEPHFQKMVTKSSLVFVNPRIDVKWGHINFVKAEFLLFLKAYEYGLYSYFHLILLCGLSGFALEKISRRVAENAKEILK